MIRLLLAAIAIVLYLVLTFPVLCFLEKKAKRTRRRQAGRAFPWCGGFLKNQPDRRDHIRGVGAGKYSHRPGGALCGKPQKLF